jgi:hypothetical protein
MTDFLPTGIIGRRYQLKETLGRGGMGAVYQAEDLLSGHTVALKQVAIPASQLAFASRSGNDDMAFALAQEFRTLATIRHPHIISVFDFGFDQQRQPYFTMEYLDGSRNIMDAGRSLAFTDQISLILQMLQALVYLHRRGILHRDLKPSNALVINGQLKLLDFGLSVITSRTMEHLTQTTAGTLAYMAPELFQGAPYSQASDLYAVGVIAFELLTGDFPYDQSNLAVMIQQVLTKQVDASSFGLADSLAQVLNRLLIKSREDRYKEAAEVIADLCMATGLPLPSETKPIREGFLQAAKFVGRDAELSYLTSLLRKATAGRGAVILVGGESGVGKSRLLDELRARALVEGVLVLRGQAVSDGRIPYQLWHDVVRAATLYADLDDEELSLLVSMVPDMDRLVNRKDGPTPGSAPSMTQTRLSQAMIRLLGGLDQPTMVIMEDMQWAGPESVRLLKDLAPAMTNQPVMFAGTYRTDRSLPILSELTTAEHLHLDRLTNEDIAELGESMLGPIGRDPRLVALLERETEGNAFFLVEAVRSLAEEAGRLDRISATSLPDSIVAGGIQAILSRYLDRVPTEARPLLQLASVAGRVLDLALLRALESQADLEPWLALCTDLAVLEPYGETWRFSHDKLREEIKDRLSHDLHHALHRRVAEGLESIYLDASEQAAALAHHWTVAGNEEKALHYCEIAGHQAARNNANEEAIIFFERGLALLLAQPESNERDQQELALLMGLGPPLMALRGTNAPEVIRTYNRARDLAAQTG